MTGSKRLMRSSKDRIIFGVCGGLGEYFEVDSTIIRIIFVLLTLFGGSGLIIYLILALVVPSENQEPLIKKVKETAKKGTENEQKTSEEMPKIANKHKSNESRLIFGVLLLTVGVIFLLQNIGFAGLSFEKLWPVFLVIIGLMILAKRI